MGWFWGNALVKDESSSSQAQDRSPQLDSALQPTQATAAVPDHSGTPPRDEPPDNQLHALLEELRGHNQTKTPPSNLETRPSDESSISPNALYPKTMSCRQAFDSAFYCQSLGGQFVNVYRYGGIRNCSGEWGNFWFCMRTNRGLMNDEERAGMIQEHYRKRETKYKNGPSCEDVWRMREVRLDNAFEGDLEALEAREKKME